MQGSALFHFILRRIAIAIPLLLLVSFGVFALVHLAPGDPARALLGARGPQIRRRSRLSANSIT